jgi:hypothetical protein
MAGADVPVPRASDARGCAGGCGTCFHENGGSGLWGVYEFHHLHHGVGGQSYSDVAEMSGRIAAAAVQTGLGLRSALRRMRHCTNMHIAAQVAQVNEVLAHPGARPVAWLLGHATQMDAVETAGLAATGAVAGLCPMTESNLGDGIVDGVGWLAAQGRFGVGSDSNVRISLTEELRVLE